MCLVVMMFGCRNSKPQQPAFTGDGAKRNTSQSISSTASLQKEKTEEIKTAVVNIEKNVTESLKKTEEIIFESENILTITTDESIKPSINTIIEDAKDIDAEMVSITQEYEKIKTSTVSIEKYTESIQKDAVVVSKLQDQIAELQNKSKEAQQAAIKELYTTLSFFFGLGFLTIVAGVVIAFLVNRKLRKRPAWLAVTPRKDPVVVANSSPQIFHYNQVRKVLAENHIGLVTKNIVKYLKRRSDENRYCWFG
jgi:ElaB/YqjD/DUF883 family membrane-anchored ribosome-binding protein